MKLYNSLTHKKEELIIENNKVRIYACGPTVYNYFHIGNARAFLAYDVLRRYLEFLGYEVDFVQNFTDVDDKMIRKANEDNITIKEVADRYINEYYIDADGLNIKRATMNPRATENINEIIDMIKTLIEKDYAYSKNGNVYFRVRAYDNYGQLINQPLEDLESGARIDISEEKEDSLDFTLWKAYKEGEPYWASPWGNGRPGWHIECSAMAKCYLGKTIDIHCGGSDLVFPHHENEIAQSECANGCKFSKFWFHVAFINVENKKMSKSKNNFFTVRDLAQVYGYEPLRYFAVTSYYKSPINYDPEIIEQAKTSLDRLYNCLDKMDFLLETAVGSISEIEKEEKSRFDEYENLFKAAMDDDINAANGIAVIFEMAKDINKTLNEKSSKQFIELVKGKYVALNNVLGLLYERKKENLDEKIEEFIQQRQQARKDKNFALADKIRDELKAAGIVLEDTSSGIKWKKI